MNFFKKRIIRKSTHTIRADYCIKWLNRMCLPVCVSILWYYVVQCPPAPNLGWTLWRFYFSNVTVATQLTQTWSLKKVFPLPFPTTVMRPVQASLLDSLIERHNGRKLSGNQGTPLSPNPQQTHIWPSCMWKPHWDDPSLFHRPAEPLILPTH